MRDSIPSIARHSVPRLKMSRRIPPIRARKWKCAHCASLQEYEKPSLYQAPCPTCGGPRFALILL